MAFARRAATVAGAARSTGGRYPLAVRIKALPSMVAAVLRGTWAGASRGKILLSLVGIGYVLSPLDLLPEVLLGPFGLGDDLAIALVSVASLLSAAEAWLDAQAPTAASAHGPASGHGGGDQPGEVIPGEVLWTSKGS